MLIILRVESNERFDWLMGLIFCYFSKDHDKIQTYGANMQSEFTTELFSGLILITGSSFAMISTAGNGIFDDRISPIA